MTHTHAVPRGTEPTAGQCTWEHTSHGVLLDCTDNQLPGEQLCAEHYIAHVQSTPDPDVRRFGPVVVKTSEVQA